MAHPAEASEKPLSPQQRYRRSEKGKATQAKYAEENREKLRAYRTQWARENRDREKAYKQTERAKALKKAWREKNRDRIRAYKAERAAAYRERYKAKERKGALRRKFGLTPEQYDVMLKEQGGGCKICHEKPSKKHLAVDHCHKTGRVRGILCDACNQGLGRFKDLPELLLAAAEYLK